MSDPRANRKRAPCFTVEREETMTRGDGWSRRGSRMNSKRASRFLFAQKEEGSSPGVFCKEISTDGEGKPGDRRGGHVPGCGVIMMELLPSGKTLVNLSLNFVHFMTHLYICVCVYVLNTHTKLLFRRKSMGTYFPLSDGSSS